MQDIYPMIIDNIKAYQSCFRSRRDSNCPLITQYYHNLKKGEQIRGAAGLYCRSLLHASTRPNSIDLYFGFIISE